MDTRRDCVVAELEQGSPTIEEVGVAIARRRPIRDRDWLGRLVAWLAFWRRRSRTVETRDMGPMPREKHAEMVRFARDSGNAPMLEMLRPK